MAQIQDCVKHLNGLILKGMAARYRGILEGTCRKFNLGSHLCLSYKMKLKFLKAFKTLFPTYNLFLLVVWTHLSSFFFVFCFVLIKKTRNVSSSQSNLHAPHNPDIISKFNLHAPHNSGLQTIPRELPVHDASRRLNAAIHRLLTDKT